MATITFSFTDEDLDRFANRLAVKMAAALKQSLPPIEQKPEQSKQSPPQTPSAEWLTLSDIQRMFQVSRATVYRWTHEEGMPIRRVGGVVRLPADKVREWAEKHSITDRGTGINKEPPV